MTILVFRIDIIGLLIGLKLTITSINNMLNIHAIKKKTALLHF